MVLSATWLSSFVPAITDYSSNIRRNEFTQVQSYLDKIVQEVVLVVNTAKSQLQEDNLKNPSHVEFSLFSLYKSESIYHNSLPMVLLIGNETKSRSIIQYGPIPAYVEIGTQYQDVYYCLKGITIDYCARSSTPNVVKPKFDLSILYQTALSNPGKSLFTPSFPVGPGLTFVTMVSSWPSANSTMGISNYFAFCMEVARISQYLEGLVSNITRSTAFIIETDTDNLIAVNNKTIALTYSSGGSIIRSTGLTVKSDEHNVLAKHIYATYPDLTSLTCNTFVYLTTSTQYITLYRYCSPYKLDWVIALSSPQWNYISPIIIALIAAILGSLVIIALSVIIGVVFSFRIVRPFKILMFMFEQVANMDIDAALNAQELNKSFFSEMSYVQVQFTEMLKKLKMYRAFIPSYLLSEIDGNKATPENKQLNQSTASKVLNSLQFTSGNLMGSIDGSLLKSDNRSSATPSSKKSSTDKFSLYLETRSVSFIALYLDGLDLWYRNEDCKGVVNLISHIFEHVSAVSRTTGYNIGSFDKCLNKINIFCDLYPQ